MTDFRHEALFYTGGLDGFVGEIVPMIAATLASGGSAAVAAPTDRIERLAGTFGSAEQVDLVDMTELGVNPARIIPAWRELADRALATGRPFLGVGEPIWAGRSAAEIDECHRHEALINVAFGEDPAWRLVCPYDVDGLDPSTVSDARMTHPTVLDPELGHCRSPVDGLAAFTALERPLSPVPDDAVILRFEREDLGAIRALAGSQAAIARLSAGRTGDLLLAVTEMVTNSIRHGGGAGTLSIWRAGRAVVCQSKDAGRGCDPMVGRCRPSCEQPSGRGVWIMHQLCDLVQIRSAELGTTVRATIR